MSTAHVVSQRPADWIEAGAMIEQMQTLLRLLLNEDYRLIDPQSESFTLINICDRLLGELNELLGALEESTTRRGDGAE